jgi:O-antigen ligase
MRRLAYCLTIAFVFAVPWENAIHVANIGRISKMLGFAAFAVWTVSVVARGRLRQPDAFQKAYFFFLIWNGLTLYWSIDPGATITGFRTYTELFGLLLMFWDLFDSKSAIRPALQAYVLGAYVASGSIVVNFLTAAPDVTPEHQRFQALGYQTDGIALVVAIAGPAAWYLAAVAGSQERVSALRIANYAYLPVALFALTLTGTRGAALASVPTAAFVLWSLRRGMARPAVALTVIAAAVVAIVAFAPRTPLARIATAATVTDLSDGALSGRIGIWTESHEVFRSRPITGAGLDAHRAAIPTGKEAHNTYVSVLAETGVVGLLLFVGVMLSVVARVRSSLPSDGRYWIVQLAVLAIGAMSLSLEDSKSVWIFLSLAVASGAAAPARRSALELVYGSEPSDGLPRADLAAVEPDEAFELDDLDRAISALEHELEAGDDGAAEPQLPGRAVDRGVRRR